MAIIGCTRGAADACGLRVAGERADAVSGDIGDLNFDVVGTVVAVADGLGLDDLQRFWQVCPVLFASLDFEGVIIAGNDAWTVTLGYPTATLCGRRLLELTTPADQASVKGAMGLLRRSATTVELDLSLRSAEGRDVLVQCSLHSVVGCVGSNPTIYLRAHDVTEQRRAEAALATTSEQLQLAMQAAPIGMLLADLDGRVQVVNKAMCRLLGRSRDELLGLRLDEVADPRDRSAARAHLVRMLAGDQEPHRFELRFVGGGDRVVHGEVTGCVVRDFDGEPVYVLGQIVDVTHRHVVETRLRTAVAELEESNRRLEEANETLEHFAATASHDLRGPLGTVQMVLETVLRRPATPLHERDRDLLDRARRYTSRLVESIDALLTLSSHHVVHPELTRVDLGRLVAEVIESLQPDLQRAHAQIEAVDLPMVAGDPAMLWLLMQNLLANAVKFAHRDRQPCIRVTAEPAGMFWEVSVTDNGLGLPAEQAERIFDRFVRAVDVHARSGSGLGLATCRQIAEAHGGDIRAEPMPVGARFVVRLHATATDANGSTQ